MNKDILICGVGGQGTVLASKIIAAAALAYGEAVHSAETIGMAQRGGSVTSHVRIGDRKSSPLIPHGSADLLLAFEPAEAVRNLKYLRKDGAAIVSTRPVRPVTAGSGTVYDGSRMTAYMDSKCPCIFVDPDMVCAPFGSSKFFNIIMLGIGAGSGRLGIPQDEMAKTIKERVPTAYVEANIKAFEKGYEIGQGSGI